MPERLKHKQLIEADIEKPVVAYARQNGVLVVKQTHAHQRSHPDRAFFFPGGRLLQIEFKAPGHLPTLQQALTIEKLLNLGYTVYIIDNKDDGLHVISSYVNNWPVDRDLAGFTRTCLAKVLTTSKSRSKKNA